MTDRREFPVRVLLAAGDAALERRLSRELSTAGVAIAARALDGPSLLEQSAEPGIDVVLASADLHRLSESTLLALRERRRPVVLLAADAADLERLSSLARVLPASSNSEVIAAAVREAESRGAFAVATQDEHAVRDRDGAGGHGSVIAVTSGKGAPGKTTVAIALAALLADGDSTVVLVDADLRGGNVAPYLDLDPRRGLVGFASSGGRLADELQDGPGYAVLAGVERPELAAAIREDTLSGVIAALRERFDAVLVDLGSPPNSGVLRAADEVLVVTGADLVSVWNAQVALRAIREQTGAALLAVVNRREGCEHYGRDEVERALGVPVLGVVREDRKAARRAVAKQIPLSAAGGRAARDLRALARSLTTARAASRRTSDRLEPSLVGER